MDYYKKRKCGVDFVHLLEGCGRTQTKINDTIAPHLYIAIHWYRTYQ